MSAPALRYEAVRLGERTGAALRASGLRIVVTGASGWMGQASLEALEILGGEFAARVLAFGSHARELKLRSGRSIPVRDLGSLAALKPEPTLLLHYAFLTKDRVAGVSNPEYFSRSDALSSAVADAIGRIGVAKMLFPSSGAVYGQPMRAERTVYEEPEANPYGTQKLRDEARFSAACNRAGAAIFIPRVFSLSGPFINKHEAYVLASAINCALARRPIELRARRRVFRSYISVRDLIELSIAWLLSSSRPAQTIVDTGGEVIEVGDLARLIARLLGPQIDVIRPPLDGTADDRYVGDGAALESLGARLGIALRPLPQQIMDTAAYLQA